MVFGIGEGKIGVTLDKGAYKPGEKITGSVKLTLNSPKKAKGIRAVFYGEKQETRYSRGKKTTHTVRIYERSVTMGGDKEYPAGSSTYNFEITVPDIERPIEGGSSQGIIGGIISFAQKVIDPVLALPWYVDVSLDLPLSFDISKKIRITLQR
jgi:hypothetical protein